MTRMARLLACYSGESGFLTCDFRIARAFGRFINISLGFLPGEVISNKDEKEDDKENPKK